MRKLMLAFSLAVIINGQAQTYQPTWESLESRPVPQWFRDAKFGIFIHWGVYAVPGWSTKGNYSEWYQQGLQTTDSARMRYHKAKFGDRSYYDLANDFKAELFKPDEWAKLFEASGAKYIVLTSKHHDGFTLWPSKEADKTWGFPWNAGAIGPKRDLLGDLFKAIRKTTVRPGMYYSLYEWFNPLWKADKDKYRDQHVWPQMKELINTYQPDVFWTDGDWDVSDEVWKSKQFISWMYNESPVKDRVVTYDRWGSNVRFHHGSVYTPEYQPDLDFEDHYWEESRGMGASYGYNREEDAWDYNSAQSLVLQLIDKASRGGNFLLDIGPDEHGKIPPIMQERLLQIGEWLKINGEAIYNTERWKIHSQWSEGKTDYKPAGGSGDLLLKLTVDPDPGYAVKEVFYTYNSRTNALYAILPRYPSDRKIRLKGVGITQNKQVTLLSTGESLKNSVENGDLLIDLPIYDPNKFRAPYAYAIRIDDFGKFAPKPVIHVDYKTDPLKPSVSIVSAPGTRVRYRIGKGYVETYTSPFNLSETALITAVAEFSSGDGLPSAASTVEAKTYTWKNAMTGRKFLSGIQYKYYEPAEKISMASLESDPKASGLADNISLKQAQRKDRFAFRFEGYIKIENNAVCNWFLASDDGSKLFIDDELVIDNGGEHGTVEKEGKAALKKGFHKIRVDYFDSGGGNELKLSLQAPGSAKMELPSSMLYH
jgi:alpha-L-fucosidase